MIPVQWQKDFDSCVGKPRVKRGPVRLTALEKRTEEDELEDIADEYKREFGGKP
jgi:hypothetical protein